jgi:hypothetical protein
MSTPGLWAHTSASWDDIVIRQYLARAGSANIMLERTTLDDNGPLFVMDAPLAQTCFRRARAVAISLYEVYDDRSLSVIIETMDQPAPRLSTLRLIQELDEDCFMDCFGLYPAFTRLSISKGKIEKPISIRLPLLTHLHLCNTKIDGNLQ